MGDTRFESPLTRADQNAMTVVYIPTGRCELALAQACVDQLTSRHTDLDVAQLEDEFVTHIERAADVLPPEDTDLYWDSVFSWLDQLVADD